MHELETDLEAEAILNAAYDKYEADQMSAHHAVVGAGASKADSTAMDTGDAPSSSSAGKKRKLPGTAKGQGSADAGDGGGVSGASGGLVLPRPDHYFSTNRKVFEKRFKFLTSGFANKIFEFDKVAITGRMAAHSMYYMSTGLASLPVDRVWFYMSPQEFSILQEGDTVMSVKVVVIQRNVRVGFETNASTSQLATLNQNKNGLTAEGLNLKGYGVDLSYTADTAAPMVPSAVAKIKDDLSEQFYGVPNKTTDKFKTVIPCAQVGNYYALPNYFCMATSNLQSGGWPNLQCDIEEFDAADHVGSPIVAYEYQPKMGILKPDPLHRLWGAPDISAFTSATAAEWNAPDGVGNSEGRQSSIIQAGSGTLYKTLKKENETGHGDPSPAAFDYTQRIEKAGWMSTGLWGNNQHQHVQPSLHVGVGPVPSELAATGVPTKWTNVQAYFDVVTTMEVMHHEGILGCQTSDGGATRTLDSIPSTKRYAVHNAPEYLYSCFAGKLPETINGISVP